MDEKRNPRSIATWLVPLALIVWFPYRFYYDIAHYHTHFDDMLAYLVMIIGVVFCAVRIIRWIRQRQWGLLALYMAALAVVMFFGYWIWHIPFCTECDHVTESDLGFMLRPYADTFGPFWGE